MNPKLDGRRVCVKRNTYSSRRIASRSSPISRLGCLRAEEHERAKGNCTLHPQDYLPSGTPTFLRCSQAGSWYSGPRSDVEDQNETPPPQVVTSHEITNRTLCPDVGHQRRSTFTWPETAPSGGSATCSSGRVLRFQSLFFSRLRSSPSFECRFLPAFVTSSPPTLHMIIARLQLRQIIPSAPSREGRQLINQDAALRKVGGSAAMQLALPGSPMSGRVSSVLYKYPIVFIDVLAVV